MSGNHIDHASHAWLDQPRHMQLSPEPAVARRQLERALGNRWAGDVSGVLLAVSEALVNAQRHAGGARRAEAWVNGSSVVVQVCDRGPAFDPRPYIESPPDVMAERGRGLWLISRLADACQVHRERDGGCLVLRFDVDDDRDPERSRFRPD